MYSVEELNGIELAINDGLVYVDIIDPKPLESITSIVFS
jgi:hypothetical protein